MPNNLWSITFGDYEFILDRRALTYRLTETQTSTVWGDGLSVGWIELEERDGGARTRYDFGACRLLSLSEKAGPQGKRILLGLDCQGVPIDVYFTCTQREIQLTVEASRDTKTHRVQAIGLLPGLCAVPENDLSYLVYPLGEGAILFAKDAPTEAVTLPFWNNDIGLTMPFFGAVRSTSETRSALGLLTDSAYAALHMGHVQEEAVANLQYERDPERRRLDVRVVPIAGGDYVAIARAYREKIVGEKTHITLRRKIRERPEVGKLLGSPLFVPGFGSLHGRADAFTRALKDVRSLQQVAGIDQGLCVFCSDVLVHANFSSFAPFAFPSEDQTGPDEELEQFYAALKQEGFTNLLWYDHNEALTSGFNPLHDTRPESPDGIRAELDKNPEANARPSAELLATAPTDLPRVQQLTGAEGFILDVAYNGLQEDKRPAHRQSRWDDMENRLGLINTAHASFPVVGTLGSADWSAVAVDFWWLGSPNWSFPKDRRWAFSTPEVPLSAVVYHDSVVQYDFHGLAPLSNNDFLRYLLRLSPPTFRFYYRGTGDAKEKVDAYYYRVCTVLTSLHRLTFPAFMTAHRFLTPNFEVEEAVYSDKTRIVINQSRTESYENEELSLPPGGFYVRHPQLKAHDALRVGETTFETRAWRVTRSQDEKPLETSADVLRQEFPV
jgi:hypothetical protein